MLLTAIFVGAALLQRSRQNRTVPAPPCADPATCGVPVSASPATAKPTTSPTTAPPTRVEPPPLAAPPAVPADGAALRAEADRLIAERKIVEAIDVFRKAVEAAPTATNHGDLGGLLARLTAFDEAALHLRAAAELDPGNADRWIALANVYYRKVNPGEAWKAEKRAREAEPGLELGRDNEGMRVRKGAAAAKKIR